MCGCAGKACVVAAAGCDRRRSRGKGGVGNTRRPGCGLCEPDRSLRQRLQGLGFQGHLEGVWADVIASKLAPARTVHIL
ncbi:hypothetical protein EMIT0324P_130004 [Pseudomonas chlororaphis]